MACPCEWPCWQGPWGKDENVNFNSADLRGSTWIKAPRTHRETDRYFLRYLQRTRPRLLGIRLRRSLFGQPCRARNFLSEADGGSGLVSWPNHRRLQG